MSQEGFECRIGIHTLLYPLFASAQVATRLLSSADSILSNPRSVENLEVGELIQPPVTILDPNAAPLHAAEGQVRMDGKMGIDIGSSTFQSADDFGCSLDIGTPH
jgi:hypothetical protein